MNAILKGTHVRDFVLKTIGGATAPKTQKRMHTYLETMGKKRIKLYMVEVEDKNNKSPLGDVSSL